MSNPATRAGVDPLAGRMPCFNENCEAPQGDFQKRADLERLLEQSGKEAGDNDASEGRLTDAIREAVDIAIVSFFSHPTPFFSFSRSHEFLSFFSTLLPDLSQTDTFASVSCFPCHATDDVRKSGGRVAVRRRLGSG